MAETRLHPLPCLLLAGPTAVGKSAVALELARRLGGEIVSVDSMQVYRGMDIGTAKPSIPEQREVPHHLIDILDVTEPFDAAQFVRRAQEAVEGIRERGHWPILCGGTGLYFRAWLEGLGSAPPSDPQVRLSLERTPLAVLLEELAWLDPATYERIDRRNPRRVVRALEVIRLTGRPFSTQRASWSGPVGGAGAESRPRFWGLRRGAEDLRRRMEQRVEAMFAAGLVEETRRLLAAGLGRNPTAGQAIGYRQVVEYLRGDHSLEETMALVKIRTWQYARRQMTWFRRQAGVTWLELGEADTAVAVAERILAGMTGADSGPPGSSPPAPSMPGSGGRTG